MSVTCAGIICVARNTMNRTLDPRNRIRANAYPAIDAVIRVPTTTSTVM